jgi:hypothetical protein
MLFDPIESFEDSPIQFTVEAHLEDSSFEQGLQSLENRVKSSSALDDKRIIIESYVNLNDVVAKSKLASLYTEIDKTINLVVNSKINIESSNLNNTIANQNGIFTKNLERILKDSNKESFLSKIGSVITAPIRALGASANQIVKGSLFAVGETGVRPYQKIIQQKAAPITQLVGKQSERSIQTLSVALARFSGYESTSKFRKETFSKIENLTDFSPKRVFKAVKKFEDNLVSVLESLYVEKDSKEAKVKVQKYTKEIIEQPLETLFEMAGVALRVGAQPFRIRKRVELLNTIKEAELMVNDILANMSDELKNEIKKAKGVTLATGGIDFQKNAENTYFSANLVRKLTPGNVTIPVQNTYSNDESTLGGLYKLRQSILPGKAMPLDRLLQVGVETGRNSDAAKMLATAMAVRKIDSNKPILFTGSSGGSALVEEVISAAERAALKKVKGIGLTLPGFDLTRTASKKNYKTLIGDYDPLSISAFGSKYDDGSKYFKKALGSVLFDAKGLLNLGSASERFPKLGTGHHLADFLSDSKVQSVFTKFAGTSRIDPGYTGDRKNFEFASKLYSESQSISRTIGVLLGDFKSLHEIAKGEYSFIDPGHPEYRRDNDFSAMTQNFEKLKVQGSDLPEYEKFLNFLHRFKTELTNFYEIGALQENTIPQSLKNLANEGKQFFNFREGTLQDKYNPKYQTISKGFENKPLDKIPNGYTVFNKIQPNDIYQLPISNPLDLQPRVNLPELAGNAIDGVKNTIQSLAPVADMASNALGKVVSVLGDIAGERLEQRVEGLRGSSEQPLLTGRGEIVQQKAGSITPTEVGQIARADIATTVKVIERSTEQIIKFADGTIKAGKAARDFIRGFISQGKTIKDLGDAVIEVSVELLNDFNELNFSDSELKALSTQILYLKSSIDEVNGTQLALPSSEINEEQENFNKLTKAVYELSNAFESAKKLSLDISSIQTGDFDISKLQKALVLIQHLEKSLDDVRKVEKLTFPKGSEKLIPQVREIQNPIGRLKSGAYKGILAQLPQIKEAADAGDKTAQGFINGLISAIPQIENVANKSGIDFITSLKFSLGIASPARKLIQPGIDTIKGFIVGINQAKGLLKNSVLDLASAFIIYSENAFKGSIDPNVYIKATALRNADLDVKNSNLVDNIVKDLNKQVINSRPNFEQEKYVQDKVKDLNKQVRLNAPKIIQNKLEYKIDRETIRSEQGSNKVNRHIPLPTSILQEKEIYRSKGLEQGKTTIEFIENSYNKLVKFVDRVIDKTKQFINGNKEIQRSVGYIQGLGQNWNEAKDKLGNYLSQFQVFGIQGSTFAKLGLGAIGIFAFAKGVEYLKNQMGELIEVSRQSSKVEQFFKDATSKPKDNIEKIGNFADKVGLDRLSLLQSSAEQTVGLKTTGYDESKALSIVDKLTKVSVGRRFSADESSRFFRPILQIASKDKFSLEETQQQLGDIGIYGAPKLAAKATGFGNNQASFLKATSQGEVSANVIGKDGLTNLERFVKLLEKTYGSSNELDPLVATTTRINNNFKQLQINTGKSIEPLLQLSDPVINGGLTLLSNNANLVVGSIKTLGVISISLVIPALFKMATTSKLLAGAFALVNEQGLRGAVSTTIGASKWAKWGLAATAAISSVNSFQSTYINNTNDAIKALDKLIKKENERKNSRKNTSNIFNSEGSNSRYKAAGDIFGNIGNTILSGLSLDAVGVVESIKGVGNSVTNTIYGSDNTIDTFGRSVSTANKDQNKNRKERDKAREVIKNSKNDIIEANKIAQDLKEGKFVNPERLKNSQTKIGELNEAFKQISLIVKENDKGIKDFSTTLEKLDDDLFNISVQGRNLTVEMNKLKTQLEENKLVSLKIDLETEVNKSGLPFNDTKVTSLYDFSSEQKKLDTELELQEKLAKAATEKYNSVDYQNLLNSTVEGQLEKANQIKSDALQEQQRLIELQISKQKSVNNRRKELFNQEKEELMFINSSRKLKNEISQTELRNSKRLEIFNKTGNLDTVQSKFELAKLNVDSILNQSSQNSLAIDDNEKLYKKGLISTYEYQTNLLEGRKKQAELESQFNDSLIELNNIEKEKANILLDLTSKQKEYDNKLKDNSLTISQTIIDNYGKIKKEIKNLNSEINNLTSESLNDLSSVLTDKIDVIKNIFGDSSNLKGNEYALKSYLGTLERISGIRINKNKLAEDSDGEYQAKLLFQIEVSKVNIQIQGLRLKKEGLIEELVIQRKILDIEQQKARFNADQDVEKAQVNLQKAQIKQDPNEIALAQIDLNSALKNREFLTNKQDIEKTSQLQLDELKLRSLDVEGAKLSLGLKKDLIGNENLKPFGNVDPYKELSDFISRNLRPFENSYQYQKNMASEVKYQAPLPQLNITNNFNGARQDNLDYGNIGRQIGAEAMKAFQTYRSGIVNSVK